MCWRPGCMFKDLQRSESPSEKEILVKLLVIGASGMTGKAVVEAAVACVWFRVSAFTRNPENLQDNRHVRDGKVRVVKGDMLQIKTLYRAMQEVDVVFFNTVYWDTMDPDCEYSQGCNVVEAAQRARIKHLVYVGTPYCDQYASQQCRYLVGREQVQDLVVNCGLPSTVVHMGFYYENFMSVFKPHMVEPYTYALALPLGNVALNCGSLLDFAHCIAKMILQPKNFIGTTIKLAFGYHTVTQLAAWLDKQFDDLNFYDPKIPIEEYQTLSFEGCEDISAMFVFMQAFPNNIRWDQRPAFNLCQSGRTFKEWLAENHKVFLTCLYENLNDGASTSTEFFSRSGTHERLPQPPNKRRNTKGMYRTKHVNEAFDRRAAICDQLSVLKGFRELWRNFLDADG